MPLSTGDKLGPYEILAPIGVWSPDGRSIVYVSDNKLHRLEINGGSPQILGSMGFHGSVDIDARSLTARRGDVGSGSGWQARDHADAGGIRRSAQAGSRDRDAHELPR